MSEKVDKNKTWEWLSKSNLKIGTEALLCATQEQAIRTNYVMHHIDKTSESPLCRLCGKKVKVQGFPNGVDWCGGQFGENCQKLHENYKMVIFGSKQWGTWGDKPYFWVVGGRYPPPPVFPTRGNPELCNT